MKKILIEHIFFFLLLSCNPLISQSNQQIQFGIEEVQEFDTFYLMKSRMESKNEIFYLISLKSEFYDKIKSNYYFNYSTASNIEVNKRYKFVLQQVKPRVSNMDSFGVHIIIDNDTLWSGNSYKKAPKTYITLNTIGLKINN